MLKDGFRLPMLLSMFLLFGFLSYFIYTEFINEEENILIEKREKVFKEAFSKLENFPTGEKLKLEAKPTTWEIDSINNNIALSFKHLTDSSTLQVDAEISVPEHKNSAIIYSDFDKETPAIQALDSVSALVKKIKSTENLIIKDADKGIYGDAKIGIVKITDEDGKVSLSVTGVEVKSIHVLKRILPQILFSLLLLGIVGISFYLSSRTLKRERELALLRNDLMSNMSHELKTPISTVGVALEALSNFDAANDPKLRKEYIDISRSEVKRLGLLVDKALNISLFEQGKFIYEKQTINLNEEIERILKTLNVQLKNNQAKIEYVKSGSNFRVKVDKTHLINVIHNLIENAIKYSSDSAEIFIQLKEDAGQLKLSIKDNGIGIPSIYQNKVFDKFFRVPQGNKHNVKGHGLGLSYVKEVITNQGGKILLESEEGIGSTFTLELPKLKNEL